MDAVRRETSELSECSEKTLVVSIKATNDNVCSIGIDDIGMGIVKV